MVEDKLNFYTMEEVRAGSILDVEEFDTYEILLPYLSHHINVKEVVDEIISSDGLDGHAACIRRLVDHGHGARSIFSDFGRIILGTGTAIEAEIEVFRYTATACEETMSEHLTLKN